MTETLTAAPSLRRNEGRIDAPAIEWPTALLTIGIFGGWLLLIGFSASLPLYVVAPIGWVLIAWHSSLQHEILHGHPTRWRQVNRALGMVPLSLWLPYVRYRQTHLLHHMDERLTDPLDDPESYYWTPEDWRRLGPIGQRIVRFQATLAGRLLIGPAWSISRFLATEARMVIEGRRGSRRMWAEHLIWCVPVVLYVTMVGGMPLWLYLLAIVYPGTSLLLVRSFAEHKAEKHAPERTAIVENSWILGPIFLFNNLHALHHEAPMIPWYQIPAWYRANRADLLRRNGGLVYDSYFDVARRFMFRTHDVSEHPMGRVPR